MQSLARATAAPLNRVQGSFVGSLVGTCLGMNLGSGDAPGWTHSFDYIDSHYSPHNLEEEMKRRGQWPVFLYSSHHVFLREIALAAREPGFSGERLAARFVAASDREPHRSLGPNFGTIIEALRTAEDWRAPAKLRGRGLQTAGSAATIVPLACLDISLEDLDEAVTIVSELTNCHPNAILCSKVHARALRNMLADKSVWTDVFDIADGTLGRRLKEAKAIVEDLDLNTETMVQKLANTIGTEARATMAVPLSVATIGRIQARMEIGKLSFQRDGGVYETSNTLQNLVVSNRLTPEGGQIVVPEITRNVAAFQEAIYTSMALGGDSRAIVNLTGALAGAGWGIEAIPRGYILSCEDVAGTRELAAAFCKTA